ncbi:MAG: hypothetical protein IT327_03400 [Anaerolineae bacterium]|nr:hypothetical protein [Anaerolineae bacterium]
MKLQSEIPWYFELGEQAIHELVLLTSIYDCQGCAEQRDILKNIRERRYFRQNTSRLTTDLEFFLPDAGYVERIESQYQLTKRGKIRLRDLCELACASPSAVTQINKEGFERFKGLRITLGMYPFTRGRLLKDGPRDREISNYCVYAILLSETALQIRYRALNRNHNPKMPCVYVGMSQYTPRERLGNHRYGKLGSEYVYDQGICLIPLIYSHLNRNDMSRQEALETERELSECLRQYGFAVFAGHHDIAETAPKPKALRK